MHVAGPELPAPYQEPRTTPPWVRRPGCPHCPAIGSPLLLIGDPTTCSASSSRCRPATPTPPTTSSAPASPRPRRRSASGSSSSATTTSATRSSSSPTPAATATGSPCWPRSTREAEYIVFCGVHFMAESADILTGDHQQVVLPDLNAGCSMADMADIDEVEEAWESLSDVIDIERLVPITYMNSSAALKAFVGRHGGAVCTSTNARAVLEWALHPGRQGAVLPRPAPGPQHRRGDGLLARRHGGVEPPPRAGRPDRGRGQGGDVPAVEGPLLDPPALLGRAGGRRSAPSTPTGSSSSTPRRRTTRSSPPTRSARPTSSSRPSRPRRRARRSPSAPRSTS